MQMPRSCPGGGWAQLELTGALADKHTHPNSRRLELKSRALRVSPMLFGAVQWGGVYYAERRELDYATTLLLDSYILIAERV